MPTQRDESLLAVAMYLISQGEPRERVSEMLIHFGWDEKTARFAVLDIVRHLPDHQRVAAPNLKSFVSGWLAFAGLILLSGDFFVVLPPQFFWRVVTSLGYAVLIPAVFLMIWSFFSVLWARFDR